MSFVGGVKPYDLGDTLERKCPTSKKEILEHVHDKIRIEEAYCTKKVLYESMMGSSKKHDHKASKPKRGQVQDHLTFAKSQASKQRPFKEKDFIPLNASRAEIMTIMNRTGTLVLPTPMVTPNDERDRSKFYQFHESHGHKTMK